MSLDAAMGNEEARAAVGAWYWSVAGILGVAICGVESLWDAEDGAKALAGCRR